MRKIILIGALCCLVLAALITSIYTIRPSKPEISESEIERMIGQMIIVGFRGNGEKTAQDIPYVTNLVTQGKIGGVILFNADVEQRTSNRNIVDSKQLKKLISGLQAVARIPLFIAVDQEGGQVQRLKPEHGFTRWPYPEDMTLMSEATVEKIGLELGGELRSVGINLDFAPCVDVNVNPRSPVIGMIGRSFSQEPQIVVQKARAFIEGLNRAGIIGCFKHFPGHGSAMSDTHKDAADVSKTWQEKELEPYRQLLGLPGEYGVMVAHVYNKYFGDEYPASLSPAVINGILRKDLGWQGVIFTDDMQMNAITKNYSLEEAVHLSIEAGADVLVFGNNFNYQKKIGESVHAAILSLYHNGVISAERIEASYQRIMAMKATMTRGERADKMRQE